MENKNTAKKYSDEINGMLDMRLLFLCTVKSIREEKDLKLMPIKFIDKCLKMSTNK